MKKSEPVERVPESRSARSGTGGTQSWKKNRVPEPAERRNAKKNLGGTQKSKFCRERVPKHP